MQSWGWLWLKGPNRISIYWPYSEKAVLKHYVIVGHKRGSENGFKEERKRCRVTWKIKVLSAKLISHNNPKNEFKEAVSYFLTFSSCWLNFCIRIKMNIFLKTIISASEQNACKRLKLRPELLFLYFPFRKSELRTAL